MQLLEVGRSASNVNRQEGFNSPTLGQLMYIEVKHPTKGHGRDAGH